MWYGVHRQCALAFSVYLVGLTTPVRMQEDSNVVFLGCNASTRAGFDFQVEPMVGMTLHWSLSPSLETVSFYTAVAAELPGWISIGFSSDGDMIGSDAAVGFPTQGTVVEYDLDSKISVLNEPSPLQEITETAVEKADGVTSLAFTRPATPVGEEKLPLLTSAGAPTILIWAFGPSETFGYHFQEGRGAFSLDLLCSSIITWKEISTNAPAGAPVTAAPTLAHGAELFTASPSATLLNPQENESTSAPNGGVTLEPFGLFRLGNIRAAGVAGAILVVVCTFSLAVAGLR